MRILNISEIYGDYNYSGILKCIEIIKMHIEKKNLIFDDLDINVFRGKIESVSIETVHEMLSLIANGYINEVINFYADIRIYSLLKNQNINNQILQENIMAIKMLSFIYCGDQEHYDYFMNQFHKQNE